MNRCLIAVVVVGLMAVGCAAGVEDPQPAPAPAPGRPHKDPPAQPFSGELEEEQASPSKVRQGSPVPALPSFEKQDIPGWGK